ncbi:MAG: APC family permease [Candidatus Korobacteraceae bacterium]
MTTDQYDRRGSIAVAENDPTPHPRRALGLRDLVLFYVVVTLSLRWLPLAAAAGPSTIVIWLLGVVVVFLPLALCVMELSSRYPQEGGMYVWSKRAFGDSAGFLTGWIYWTSNLPYFPVLLYFAASNALYVGGTRWHALQSSPSFFIGFSIVGLSLALVLNLVGLNVGKWLNNLGAIGTWIPVALLFALAFLVWSRFGPATSFATQSFKPTLTVANCGIWATMLSAFAGAEAASFMGSEIKRPRRDIPRALIVAGFLIVAGYVLGTLAILVVVPREQLNSLEGLMQAISSSGARVGWRGLGPAVALLICIANLGAVGAYLAAVARIPFVAGIDRYLPQAFARVHPRWGTPYVALIVQALFSVLIAVMGQAGSSIRGAYQILVSTTVIATFLPYLFMFAALIRLQSEPVEPGVMRIPGGKPVATAIAIVGFTATVLVVIGSVIPDASEPNKVLAVVKVVLLSAALVLGGAALYWFGKRRVAA